MPSVTQYSASSSDGQPGMASLSSKPTPSSSIQFHDTTAWKLPTSCAVTSARGKTGLARATRSLTRSSHAAYSRVTHTIARSSHWMRTTGPGRWWTGTRASGLFPNVVSGPVRCL